MTLNNTPWWSSPLLWIALAILSAFPFFFVDLPPLTDLPNHFARYYIFLNLDRSAFLERYYNVRWSLSGNLGVDLIVRALAPILGLEYAVRVAVGAIPPLTVAGIYSVSRSVSGQATPSALIALPLVYNWPFISGFVNFALSAAVALLVFALWVRLRTWPWISRLVIFAPLAFATWIAHVAGWGLLGLAVAGFEIQRGVRARGFTPLLLLDIAAAVLPFALIMFLVIVWRSGTQNPIGIHFSPNIASDKLASLATVMREQYAYWDVFSCLAVLSLSISVFFLGGQKFSAPLLAVSACYFVIFLVSPAAGFGGLDVDRRLVPYLAISSVLVIDVSGRVLANDRQRKVISIISILSVAFFSARIAVTTLVWHKIAQSRDAHLALMNEIPEHSRVFSLFVRPCQKNWSRSRLDHIQQLVIPFRMSVTNGQFQEGDLNQVRVLFRKQDEFDPNMQAAVYDEKCPWLPPFQAAISLFPRDKFDFLWIVSENELPAYNTSGLLLVDSNAHDRLYRIEARE